MTDFPQVGWREWVTFPDLDLPPVKAKVDTGARTSAIHAYDVRREDRDGQPWAVFEVHPHQRDDQTSLTIAAPIVDERAITSSNGEVEDRLVVTMRIALGQHEHDIEVTLTNRDSMGFRMLLGRTAVAGAALVDPSRSYLLGRPDRTDQTTIKDPA